MNKNLEATVYWFLGIILTFSSVLVVLLYLMAEAYGIQPETLSSLTSAWIVGSAVVALSPALMTALDVADDALVQYFAETGRLLVLYCNFVAWAVWLVMGLMSLLFAFAFWDELIGPCDDDGQDPLPTPLYRRVWEGMKTFFLAVLIMVLPNKDGEVPD